MGFGLHVYTLEQRIKEIRLCLAHQMWQAALALALTIPDICGQIKFAKLKIDRGGKLVKANIREKYSRWFQEHVEHYFDAGNGLDNDGPVASVLFDGNMCYELRCAFIHSGDDATNIEKSSIKYKFNLRINYCPVSYQKIETTDKLDYKIDSSEAGGLNTAAKHLNDGELVCVDIESLCNFICEGALKFYREWDKPQDFANKRCEWLDVKECVYLFRKYNANI